MMREDYKREGLYDQDNFEEYGFLTEEGSFYATYVGRWMNKDENLVCCFDFDDGRKVRSMVWKDSGYHKLEQIPLGSTLRLEFKLSCSGRNYLRKVVIISNEK